MIDYRYSEESIASWIEYSRAAVERSKCDDCVVLYAHLIASFRCLKKAHKRIRSLELFISELQVKKIIKDEGAARCIMNKR
jgi:hypothetical protein